MRFLIFISFVLFISNQNKLENPIIRALKSDHPKIKKVTEKIDQHELQIMISYIDEKNNSYDYDFNLNAKNYFYPASTVKFPLLPIYPTPLFNFSISKGLIFIFFF